MRILTYINIFFSLISFHFVMGLINNQNQCKDSVKQISKLLSSLSTCFMENAGLKSICLNCNYKYQLFMNESKFISQNIMSLNGQNCFSAFENIDKFKTVKYLMNNVSFMWNNSNCEYCFKDLYNYEYHTILQQFVGKHTELLICLEPFIKTNISLCDGVDFEYQTMVFNKTFACTNCYLLYKQLLFLYQKIREGNQSKICGDIENLFNCAQIAVEKYFNCSVTMPLIINSWPLVVIFAATLLFYSCSTMCHNKQHIQIYSQSRVIPCNAPEFNSTFGGSMSSHRVQIFNNITSNPTYEPDDISESLHGSVKSSDSQLLVEEGSLLISVSNQSCNQSS